MQPACQLSRHRGEQLFTLAVGDLDEDGQHQLLQIKATDLFQSCHLGFVVLAIQPVIEQCHTFLHLGLHPLIGLDLLADIAVDVMLGEPVFVGQLQVVRQHQSGMGHGSLLGLNGL